MSYSQSLIREALVSAKMAGGYVTEDLTLAYYTPNAFQSNEVLLARARGNAAKVLEAIDAAIASAPTEMPRAAE